jgi:anaerobic magnesium-protoporphyrin IX monomethyl ester cyclase
MKITLIASLLLDYIGDGLQPVAMDRGRECPPYGVYLLATILRQMGHEAVVADLIAQGSLSLASYEKDIAESSLIGVSATSLSWPCALDCIQSIRHKFPNSRIVLGGIHGTMFDEYILSTSAVDYVIRGEGEIALPLLVEALEGRRELGDVPSLSARNGDSVVRTGLHPPISGEEMGQFPVPDYSSVPVSVYNGLALESSRGCPFNCSFCGTSYRGSWRGIPPEEFVSRAEQVIPYLKNTKVGSLQIADDEFSAHRDRAKEICRLLVKHAPDVRVVFDCRANDLLDEELVAAMAPITCRFLVGAECGYDEGLRRVGKGTTCDKLERAAATLSRHGISECCDFSFILGLPWETQDDVLKTIDFACKLYAKYGVRVLLQWYCQMPGSALWDEAAAAGKVNASMYDNYGFFGDMYLFFSGVQLTPAEIWEVSDRLAAVQSLARVNNAGDEMIVYQVPKPVAQGFKRQALADGSATALRNLAELSQNARRSPMK